MSGRVLVGAFAGQLGEGPLDLAPDPTEGNAEDALSTLQEVDDLVGRRALIDRGTVTHQGDPGEVLDAAFTQVGDCLPDLLQRDARVQQPLDDLEDQDVAEAIQPLRA